MARTIADIESDLETVSRELIARVNQKRGEGKHRDFSNRDLMDLQDRLRDELAACGDEVIMVAEE